MKHDRVAFSESVSIHLKILFCNYVLVYIAWVVGCFGFNAPISVYIEPSPKEREKEERKDRGE